VIIIASLTLSRALFVLLVGFIIGEVALISYLEAMGRTGSRFLQHFPKTIDGFIIVLIITSVAVAVRLIVERMFAGLERASQAQQQLLQTVSELERRNREVVLLNQLTELLQVSHTADEAHQALSLYLPQFFPHEAGELYIFSSARDAAVRVARWGALSGGEQAERCDPQACWAVRRGHLVVVDSPHTSPSCGHISDAGAPPPYLCAPLLAYNAALGFLHIRSTSASSSLSKATQQLALAVAEQLALALTHLQLHASLREQSIRDPLTNLFNRRFMQESLARELQRAERTGQPLAVIFCDLDHFKYFNDTFGHAAGDDVLCALADLLRLKTRASDIVCRYGGEEFVLILPDAALEDATRRMENLRSEVKALRIQHNGQQLDQLTISIGVAAFPTHGRSAEALLKAADEAAYWAKADGRDRVIMASLPAVQSDWAQPSAAQEEREAGSPHIAN
jgi:diguanylate cyclase (GGDEF)-like protein